MSVSRVGYARLSVLVSSTFMNNALVRNKTAVQTLMRSSRSIVMDLVTS